MFYLDRSVIGLPDYGQGVAPSRQFTRQVGDVGRGLYAPYNPTAPDVVNVTYHWTGAQLAYFREAWENPDKLNFGGGWFEIDLLLDDEVRRHRVHIVQPFSANIDAYEWWAVTIQMDVDKSPALVPS